MNRSLLALVLLARCSHPAPPAAAPITHQTPAPDAAPAAAQGTIARVAALHEECSGDGGLHVVFEVLDASGAPIAIAHFGGHSYHADQRFCVGDRFTVDYVAVPRTDEDRDGNPDSSRSGWCLDGLPRFDGAVTPLARIDGTVVPQLRDQVGLRPTCAGI